MDYHFGETPAPPPLPKPLPRGYPVLAWIVIGLLVSAVMLLRYLPSEREHPEGQPSREGLANTVADLQLRYIVGAQSTLPDPNGDLAKSVLSLNQGSVSQRLRVIAAYAVLKDHAEAKAELDSLDALITEHASPLSADEEKLRSTLRKILTKATTTDEERQFLRNRWNWLGELILAPDGPARETALAKPKQTFVVILAGFGLLLIAGGMGLIGLIALFSVWAGRSFPIRLKTGDAPHHGIYVETFALWMITYVGLTLGLSVARPEASMLDNGVVAMFTSLLVVLWPVLRGVPWERVRTDIGWTMGKRHIFEPFFGVVAYVINLPLVGLGVLGSVALMAVAKLVQPSPDAGSNPAHPVIEFLSQGDPNVFLQVLLLASVGAPIMEETMFRGFLQRHLREWTGNWSPIVSAIFSGLIVSFVFAAVHPQGIIGIPVLMSLAFGFSIAREWRGTLLAPMFAHALNNATVMTLASLALSP